MADAKTRTPNFKFIIPAFDQVTWNDDFASNMRAIDALITRYFNIANYKGVWDNATVYVVGDRVVDTSTAQIFECKVAHTSAVIPTTFAQDRIANSTYWELFTTEVSFRGDWAPSTDYSAGDFVTYEYATGNKVFATAATSHTSTTGSTGFETDLTNSLWTVLLNQEDVSGANLSALAALATTGVVVRTGPGTFATRSISGGTGITVTNGDGVSGAPSIAITAGGVDTAQLANDAVTTAKLAAGSVTTAKIADANVTVAKLSGVILDEDDFASDSATQVPSQQSVRAYVNGQINKQFATFDGDTNSVSSPTVGQLSAVSDPDSIINTTIDRIIPTVAGWYCISIDVGVANNTTDQAGYRFYCRKNGTVVATYLQRASGANTDMRATLTALVYLNGSTDYIDLVFDASVSNTFRVFSGEIRYLGVGG